MRIAIGKLEYVPPNCALDLEKRQHAFASGEKKPIQPPLAAADAETNISMAGGWQDKKAI